MHRYVTLCIFILRLLPLLHSYSGRLKMIFFPPIDADYAAYLVMPEAL